MTDPRDPHGPLPQNFGAPRRMTREEANDPQRKRRSVMIALALVAFAAVVMAVTVTRLIENRRVMAEKQQEVSGAPVQPR